MEILNKYKSALSDTEQKALGFLSDLADDMDIKIYLVGGIVRDIILERKFNDIDVLLEYDAIIFSELLQKKHSDCITIIAKNSGFKTTKLEFNLNKQIFQIDVVTTRSEVYEYPSALPILAETEVPLKKDVLRRDFSINALAMSLNKKTFAQIYDETNFGLNDINNKLIRILHADSFFDDPSRIVRGLRYREKLGFKLEENTSALQADCLDSGKYEADCQERIKKEVIETLNLNYPQIFDKFISEDIFRLITGKISKKNIPGGSLINQIINANITYINPDNIWIIFLGILFCFSKTEDNTNIIKKLSLTKNENKILSEIFDLKNNINQIQLLNSNYSVYTFFKKYTNEAITSVQCILKNADDIEKTQLYLHKLKDIKLSVNGNDIQKHGLDKGIIYSKILDSTLQVKLNNNLNEKEERKYFNELCKTMLNAEKSEL